MWHFEDIDADVIMVGKQEVFYIEADVRSKKLFPTRRLHKFDEAGIVELRTFIKLFVGGKNIYFVIAGVNAIPHAKRNERNMLLFYFYEKLGPGAYARAIIASVIYEGTYTVVLENIIISVEVIELRVRDHRKIDICIVWQKNVVEAFHNRIVRTGVGHYLYAV